MRLSALPRLRTKHSAVVLPFIFPVCVFLHAPQFGSHSSRSAILSGAKLDPVVLSVAPAGVSCYSSFLFSRVTDQCAMTCS